MLTFTKSSVSDPDPHYLALLDPILGNADTNPGAGKFTKKITNKYDFHPFKMALYLRR
jgi:hypothetical protein